MATVTINGTDYTVYQDVAQADEYLQGDYRLFGSWSGLTADQKAMALVSSTRWIDRQSWQGEKVSDTQELEFGRTGLRDKNGNEVTPQQSLDLVSEASIILAADIALDPQLTSQQSSGSNIRRLRAGSASIEYFQPTLGRTTKFPAAVHDLIGLWLQSSSSLAIPYAGINDVPSLTDEENQFDLFEGYP